MAEPTFSETTERLYGNLPEFYRVADAQLDYVFKRWLSGIVDRQGEVDKLLERIDYVDPTDRDDADGTTVTGENITIEAENIDRAGTWTSTLTGVRTNEADALLSHEFYVAGGVYRFEVAYAVGPNRGIATVRIDDEHEYVIDQYSASVSAQTLTIPDLELSAGFHALRFLWTGTMNASATGTTVEVDKFGFVNTAASATAEDTSDLVDPNTADNEWLDWLGQLVGVQSLDPELTLLERRDAVRYASSGWRAGTKLAVANAAKSVLTGTRYARVYDHATTFGDRGTAGAWDVLIVTRNTETPNPETVLNAVLRKRAKPAGVVLHHEMYQATWNILEAKYPTWNAIESAESWNAIEDTQP